VRRSLEAETRNETLRLAVQRLGHTKPTKLEICRERDRRSVNARRTSRMVYQRQLRLTLERRLPEFNYVRVGLSASLAQQSSAPVYASGLVRRGQSAFAVLGVNEQETQASIDASLTFGILWMDSCRKRYSNRMVIEGLKLFVPAGCSTIVRDRMAHLHPEAAKWQLYELDQREDHLREIDCCDRGNVAPDWCTGPTSRPPARDLLNPSRKFRKSCWKLRLRSCLLLKLDFVAMAWNSHVRDLLTTRLLSAAIRKLSSE
jgi:hypothetical protein